MKTIMMILALLPFISNGTADTVDDNGHTLVKQWKSYYAAFSADKPKTQLELLDDIKEKSLDQGLAWDYYDACEKYFSTASGINWKLYDSLSIRFKDEVYAFPAPVARIYYDLVHPDAGEGLVSLLDKVRMSGARNYGFYKNSGFLYIPDIDRYLDSRIENDYEYALWGIYLVKKDSLASELLKKEVKGIKADIIELLETPQDSLDAFAFKHRGEAISFVARKRALWSEYNRLVSQKGTSDDFKALRAKCALFEKERQTFKGEDNKLVAGINGVKELVEILDGKGLEAFVTDGTLMLSFKNSTSARVTISDKSEKNKVFDRVIQNPAASYYLEDTVRLALPQFDDGDYILKARDGETVIQVPYSKSTLSMTMRSTASSVAIFVADYRSGEPLKSCRVILKQNDKVVASLDNFRLNGFTDLPASLASKLEEGRTTIHCESLDADGILHRTDGMYSAVRANTGETSRISERAVILTNSSAFHRGDTLRFKAVLFTDDSRGNCEVAGKGRKLTAVLKDAVQETVSSETFETNEYGSISGEFVMAGTDKNGYYTLEIRDSHKYLASKNLRVDDFVLPSYEIGFDNDDDRARYCGDSIRISGRICSYDGHNLSDATVSAAVTCAGESVENVFEMQSDGSFAVSFVSDPSRNHSLYHVALRLVASTGETVENSRDIFLYNWVRLSVDLLNGAQGQLNLISGSDYTGNTRIIRDRQARLKVDIGDHPCNKLSYCLTCAEDTVSVGERTAGGELDLELGSGSALYKLTVIAEVVRPGMETLSATRTLYLLKMSDGSESLPEEAVESVFVPVEEDFAEVMIGSGAAPLWIVADLVGEGNKLIASDLVPLKKGEVTNLRYRLKTEYGRAVTLNLIYFRDGKYHSWSHCYSNETARVRLPLEFVTFADRSAPGAGSTIRIRTGRGAECAVAVYDKSLENIMSNKWSPVTKWTSSSPHANYNTVCGRNSNYFHPAPMVRIAGMKTMAAVSDEVMLSDAMDIRDDNSGFVVEESFAGEAEGVNVADIRRDFATAVAFEPFLYPDSEGNMDISFKNSEKLSTYIVQVFAHDKFMDNEVLSREMLVTIPVRVALAEPQFLHEGDRYVLKAGLSSSIGRDLDGKFVVKLYDGEQMDDSRLLKTYVREITVPADSSVSSSCTIDVPPVEQLGICAAFVPEGEDSSDAVFVKIPVYKAEQRLVEAHSEILLAGADRKAAEDRLRKAFVNVDASDVEAVETAIIDMVRKAVPEVSKPESKNLISLSGAMTAAIFARRLGVEQPVDVSALEAEILKCRNEDGGFSWFEGMNSSPFLTAVLMQRLYGLRSRGLENEAPKLFAAVPDAAAYLDGCYFLEESLPYWRGGISLEQYLLVRSMFSEVPMHDDGVKSKALCEFRKEARGYLLPSGSRGLNGAILSKTRRLLTLSLLSDAPEGGFRPVPGGRRSLLKSWNADLESLKQYAVEHNGGGMYFPNAVMPFRGLLENELAAHSLLCDLFHKSGDADAEKIADGVRIWIMLQKETQQWGGDPAFVEAIASVLDGSEAALGTKVLALSKQYTVPLSEVRTAGNGFTLEREYFRDGKRLSDGDTLHVGEKIEGIYRIWNGENRSFVRITVPRAACLRPVSQLSGFAAGGYRDVRADRTEYWYESYPEEKTVVKEDYFVTQEGVFQLRAAEIESLYAPHYRANTPCGSITSLAQRR